MQCPVCGDDIQQAAQGYSVPCAGQQDACRAQRGSAQAQCMQTPQWRTQLTYEAAVSSVEAVSILQGTRGISTVMLPTIFRTLHG